MKTCFFFNITPLMLPYFIIMLLTQVFEMLEKSVIHIMQEVRLLLLEPWGYNCAHFTTP